MGKTKPFGLEKLLIGLLFHDFYYVKVILPQLEKIWGSIDYCSQTYFFSHFSPYYNHEIGGTVNRILLSFDKLIDPSQLAEIKIATNAIEAKYSQNTHRPINLDPGLVSAGRLCLATTKNAGHRIALNYGIYGEITMFYARGNFHHLPWTYPDFQSLPIQKDLLYIRNNYLLALKQIK